MSIRVGVHENVVVTKVGKNDKGSLEIGIKKIQTKSPLEMLGASTGSTSFAAEEHTFLIYPPKAVDFNGKPLDDKQVMNEIGNIVDPLRHIALQYTTEDKLGSWDIMKGTGITNENYKEKVTQQETLTKLYNNIIESFIAAMKSYVGENGKRLRAVFPRQSKAKHFPALRKRFLDRQPIFESMEVPANASKVKFSDYEISNGLNVPDQVIPTQIVSVAEAAQADALFS